MVGVSKSTVYRWCTKEPAPAFDNLTMADRKMLAAAGHLGQSDMAHEIIESNEDSGLSS
jgi:transcriptional regulator GlxA family with amidase domain